MIGHVRVLIWYRAATGGPVVDGHTEIARSLAGEPGLVSAQLHRSLSDPDSYLVISEWTDRSSFERWEKGTSHKGQTSPLRAYLDRARATPYEIHEVIA